ncbi:MAG: hypothetical protein M3141_08490, partial [Actinomycetota bacterium]|nr:hypothetical protein [Actinomycetota bacterium]
PWLDREPDGRLTDDERDVDGDGLRNQWETNGPGTIGWWTAFFKDEKPYMHPYPELDFLDPDSDGDSVADGEDDQDHDDWSNLQELVGDRADGSPLYGLRSRDLMIHPYNPCLPNPVSRTCSRYTPGEDKSWPPFDTTYLPNLPRSFPYGDSTEMGLHWPKDW